jgi:hypothetical protein
MSPVPYTKLFSAISADLRCAEPWRPGIKMRFIEEGMSGLGQRARGVKPFYPA